MQEESLDFVLIFTPAFFKIGPDNWQQEVVEP
jgi:hypothetical protein